MVPNFTEIARSTMAALMLAAMVSSCSTGASSRYFGKTVPPSENVLRYVTGPEPETLDPQLPDGQPEARLFLALYEGLVENDPKTQAPIPAIAKSWEISPTIDEFVFHLRDNAKWSDGKPITSRDFVYSMRRGFRPETVSRTANLGYFIKYSEDFNSHNVFVKKNGAFVNEAEISGQTAPPIPVFGPVTEFSKMLHSPDRLTVPGDEKKRAKLLDANPKLKAAVAGAEFVPVTAEDIGVEALDDYTLRITLRQGSPFFLGLLANPFFRLVPEQAVEKYKAEWTRPEHIVTSGAFKLKEHRPYDTLVVERNPYYWDAANVHLDRIEFYPVDDLSTIMNLYKSGAIDAELNHAVPASWITQIRNYKDEYLDFAENATAYYAMNMTKPPFDDVRVRRAMNLGLDHEALSAFRQITKPLYAMAPSGIVPAYDKARETVSEQIRVERGVSPEEWAKHNRFDPETARKLLADAGYPVVADGDKYSCPTFPTDHVSLTFATNENNRAVAEYVQAQWKQNLGITIPLKSMENKAYTPFMNSVQYDGIAQLLWGGDYLDPYTFLALQYGKHNEGANGFYDPKYDAAVDDANADMDPSRRFEKLARAEFDLMEQQPVVPLTSAATNWIKKPYIKGMYPSPGTLIPWKFVYIERDPAKWDKDVANILNTSDPQVDRELEALKSTQMSRAK